ncbi:unnamed protein product [Parascedosporium putredinis]|uniref:DUF1330 domain-containing protein n=1 Tax=Parascedosporium putredinis TaxID=1442378 RepID=A0A9P1H1Y5_9PEZI|nr:unnamed protein product [Parascedosporium putredinis]CAI7994221.1 unnamed protein product [Parascedosporium putredinis]
MVVCTLHLIALNDGVSVPTFLANLRASNVQPIFIAKVLRWIILPSHQSTGRLLARNKSWDLLLGLAPDATIPAALAASDIDAQWTVSYGVSAKVLSGYRALTSQLHAAAASARVPLPRTADRDTSQDLESSPELLGWINELPTDLRHRPVTMLNLLAFNPGKKDQYVRYGKEFSSRVGSAHGGRVKIAARVATGAQGTAAEEGWDEIAYVHYPTLNHFASMLSNEEYQAVNKEYRLGALKDTFILCTMEVGDDGEVLGQGRAEKL